MTVWGELAFGALLGLSLAVPPGPLNALIAERATRSYLAGSLTGLGAMSADLILGAVVYSLHTILDLGSDLRWVYLGGSLVLLLLAVQLLRRPSHALADSPSPSHHIYLQALGAAISNPFQILWWLTAGLAFAYLGGLALLSGLFLSVLAWSLGFPWLVSLGSSRWPRFARGTRAAAVTLLFAFAAYFVYLALRL
jgi:threonine/homoserine/homoserine lactone efflux protein